MSQHPHQQQQQQQQEQKTSRVLPSWMEPAEDAKDDPNTNKKREKSTQSQARLYLLSPAELRATAEKTLKANKS